MASMDETPSVPVDVIEQGTEQTEYSETDNIPYHAREDALPFTYGKLPLGFHTSTLNHVVPNEFIEPVETKMVKSKNVGINGNGRKPVRPTIAATCPLLRKTPSRQEFEDMLIERTVRADDASKALAVKLAQDETIQRDLDELHRRLNSTVPEKGGINETQIEAMDDSHAELISSIRPYSPEAQALENSRSETPTFPYFEKSFDSERCISPYPTPNSCKTLVLDHTLGPKASTQQFAQSSQHMDVVSHTKEVEPHLVKFAKDFSQFWYKPNMTREEAVDLLRNALPGTFLIRNSTTYRNAFGLVLRVARPPDGVVTAPGYGDQLVRHFLLEPTTRGVRLMGCANEPIFTSLSAFVYEHSVKPMALPCVLRIPDKDLLLISNNEELILSQQQVLAQGAACNVLYLYEHNMESLTGDDAIRKAMQELNAEPVPPVPFETHLKISEQGITLTDNTRKKFFRLHYPAKNISYISVDPDNHLWSVLASDEGQQRLVNKSIFAFVARPLSGSKDNQCHIFCDLSSKQPASAIVSFAHKVLPLNNLNCKML